MSTLKENVNEVKPKIKEYLRLNPDLRDDDHKLACRVWYDEMVAKGKKPKELTGTDFLKLYSAHELTNNEYIVRARRSLQLKYPELRGTKYNERHGAAEDGKHDIQETYN